MFSICFLSASRSIFAKILLNKFRYFHFTIVSHNKILRFIICLICILLYVPKVKKESRKTELLRFPLPKHNWKVMVRGNSYKQQSAHTKCFIVRASNESGKFDFLIFFFNFFLVSTLFIPLTMCRRFSFFLLHSSFMFDEWDEKLLREKFVTVPRIHCELI